ncbi:hypothetical protein, partial [Lishizhenia sp.]|uniref:hypothetical protein n=1 Tax=Lishizhenia sp. TaxID=2497594 RepID=UPI00299DFB5B
DYNQGSNIDAAATLIDWETQGYFGEYANGYPLNSSFFTYIRKGYWKDKGKKYLLLRKNTNGVLSYGWVKLEMSNYRSVGIYETAF